MEKTNYEKSSEEYDAFINELNNSMKLSNISKYDFSIKVVYFYCGNGGCFELLKHVINNNVGKTVDISDIIPKPVWNIKYVTLLNYLNNLSKCGYIKKINNNKYCSIYIINMSIEQQFKSTIFSNKEKMKILIRKNKLKDLV